MPIAYLIRVAIVVGGVLLHNGQADNRDKQDWNTRYLIGLAEHVLKVERALNQE